MRRNVLRVACLALALVLVLSGCQGNTPGDTADGEYQTIELTMAVNGTDTQIDARVGDYFAQLVEERSGGNITVAVFPNDQLANGNASRGIEMIASGSVDLAAYATCTLAVIDEKLPVATIPWIFDDYDEAVEVIDSTGKDYYAERLAAKGMTYLGSFHNGFRQLTNSKHEVRTPEDVQHLKIRVPGSVVFMGFFRALGADPTAMNWSEVFQDYLTLWNYSYESDLFIANTEVWESLEPKTQELLQECAIEACNWGRETLVNEEAETIEKFKEEGMTVTYLTDEEKAAFEEAVADFKQEMFDYFGEEACASFGIGA